MGAKASAGIVMYRRRGKALEVLLVHPGGPFWRRRDTGAWSIPKGEFDAGESAETAARREFAEELGRAPQGALTPLGEIRQSGGKRVVAFAIEGEFDESRIESNQFDIEWPPHSGRRALFPEVDRAAWFDLSLARDKIIAGQMPLLDRLAELCKLA